MSISVGDLVEPVSAEYQLASGCGRYEFAVVISVEPLVLVSEQADMRWSATVAAEHFKAFGRANPLMLERCMGRIDH
jgi:hypothetical protein